MLYLFFILFFIIKAARSSISKYIIHTSIGISSSIQRLFKVFIVPWRIDRPTCKRWSTWLVQLPNYQLKVFPIVWVLETNGNCLGTSKPSSLCSIMCCSACSWSSSEKEKAREGLQPSSKWTVHLWLWNLKPKSTGFWRLNLKWLNVGWSKWQW